MKGAFLFIITAIAATATPVIGQEILREVDLKLRGVGSGSSYGSVIAKFGQPLSKKVERFGADNSSCIPNAHTLVKLGYPGLTFELLGDGRGRSLKVVEIDVTSGRWSASTIKIGARPYQVVQRFGEPDSRERRDTRMVYYYVTPGNLGNVNFVFKGDRLIRILMIETLC